MFRLVHGFRKPLRTLPLLGKKKKKPETAIASYTPLRTFAAMVKAIRIYEHGGPEVLKWEDMEIGEPKDGEVRVKNKAIGLNFIDVYYRKGVYKADLPFTPGLEAVGVVTAVGPGLTGREVGDVVAYAGYPLGSYSEEQILPANIVVPVPSSVSPTVAAAVLLKGMTAQFLVRRCFKVEPGHTILVHAAAGGVGSLLCQWANALGATVIGTVSSDKKAAQAAEDGCHHVIINNKEDFVSRVNEITSSKGVNVVYDSVGKDTIQGSLACLKTRGYLVSFGQSSGTPDPIPLLALGPKSLFLTRPSLFNYNATRDELLECAGEVFANVMAGVLKVRINHTYHLSKAEAAHSDLENRRTTGVACEYPGKKLAFHVDSGSNSYYLSVIVEFEDGDGDLAGVDLKQGSLDSSEWVPMVQLWGADWKLDAGSELRPPFSLRLTSQYSGKTLVARNVIPVGWQPGTIYRSVLNYD